MRGCSKNLQQSFIPHRQAAEVAQPGHRSFRCTAPLITPQRLTVLGRGFPPIPPMGSDPFDAPLRSIHKIPSHTLRSGWSLGQQGPDFLPTGVHERPLVSRLNSSFLWRKTDRRATPWQNNYSKFNRLYKVLKHLLY
jgi:hypothetical protein